MHEFFKDFVVGTCWHGMFDVLNSITIEYKRAGISTVYNLPVGWLMVCLIVTSIVLTLFVRGAKG